MAVRFGGAFLTAEDLERERAYVRNLRFEPAEPTWRRVLCRILHRGHHDRAALHGKVACSCRRCGHAWTERDRDDR